MVLVVLALAFLIVTIWQSHKGGIPDWRSSALATMEHGVSTHTLSTSDDLREKHVLRALESAVGKGTVSSLETWADDTEVRLRLRGGKDDVYGLVVS